MFGRLDCAEALPQIRVRYRLPLHAAGAGPQPRAASTTAASSSITTPAERALRSAAIGRENYLVAGSDAGGRRGAVICSLIERAPS
jgi:hypothetical protein